MFLFPDSVSYFTAELINPDLSAEFLLLDARR